MRFLGLQVLALLMTLASAASAQPAATKRDEAGPDEVKGDQPKQDRVDPETDPAQPKPERSRFERAEQHFRAGKKAYEAGSYQEAIAEFFAAYELSELPGVLYSLAQAHRLAGLPRPALKLYRRFLEIAPNHAFAEQARHHVESLEKALRAAEPARDGNGETAASESAQPAAESHRVNRSEKAQTSSLRLRGRPPIDAPAGGRGRRVTGALLAGAGVAALATSAVFALLARNRQDQLTVLKQRHLSGAELSDTDGSGPAWTEEELDRIDMLERQGKQSARAALFFGIGGGAAFLAGASVYFWGLRGDRRKTGSRLSLTPSIGLSHAGLALTRRF